MTASAGSDRFDSARLKLSRAEVHTAELRGLVNKYIDDLSSGGRTLFPLDRRYDPRRRCVVVYVAAVEAGDPQWGLLVGDALQNLRSGLDHVAWRLVEEGRRPPATLSEGQQSQVQFPIYLERDRFNQALERRLPGVPRRQRAMVRAFQPYQGGTRRARFHPFAVLSRFSNADKHRVVQPIFYRSYDLSYAVRGCRDFVARRTVAPDKPVPIEPGTELLRIYGRRTGPNPECVVEIGGGTDLALEGGFWLADALTVTGKTIKDLIRELETLR